MIWDVLNSRTCRIVFAAAFLLLILASTQRLANALGNTIMGGLYRPARLLEIGGCCSFSRWLCSFGRSGKCFASAKPRARNEEETSPGVDGNRPRRD